MRYTERLADAGIAPSVGAKAMPTEVIRRKGPWRSLEAVEFVTRAWMEWFNARRLLAAVGRSRAEFEAQYYAQAAVASFNKLGRPTIPVRFSCACRTR
jgi:putative transposase